MSWARSPSFAMSDLCELVAKHLERIVGRDDVIEVEAIDRAAVHVRRRHRIGNASDQPAPLGDRVMHRKMGKGLGNGVDYGLLGRRDREEQANLMADFVGIW